MNLYQILSLLFGSGLLTALLTAVWKKIKLNENKTESVQLGIQADPGFIFLINGEPIKIGRRGFFEAPEGYEITDIAVTEPNFIMDYKYEVMEGVN